MKESKMQWQPIIEMVIVLVTILGSTIPLYLNSDAKIDKMNELIITIKDEMKEFHGRLERQDAEFKSHLMYHSELKK